MLGRVHVRKFAKNQQTTNTALLSPTRTTLTPVFTLLRITRGSDRLNPTKRILYNRYTRTVALRYLRYTCADTS
jgi:hypothetical protein